MKIVIPGGTGDVGGILRRHLAGQGHEVVVLSRHAVTLEPGVRHVLWDGRTLGPWASEVDGADAVINLAGRTVSCRYTPENLWQMMDSRIESTTVVGQAIAQAEQPPATWLQMSTATIYADRRDAPNDEHTGVIGGEERHVPAYWEFSVRIARRWEETQLAAEVPGTRRIQLRTSIVMAPDRAGAFDYLLWLTRVGLGGSVAGGGQRVSWIHADDLARAVDLLLADAGIEGPVNLASPHPVTNRELMRGLRAAWGRRLGLPATRRMAGIGAWVLRSDPEMLLKSRYVVPTRLLEAGFTFEHPTWDEAAADLVARVRAR